MKRKTLIFAALLAICGGAVNAQPAPKSVDSLVVSSAAYEASHILKASPGRLVFLAGYNSLASPQFIQLFNSATLPADTAVPVYTMTVAASSNFFVPLDIEGLVFSTGIVVSNSTTGPTKTIGAANCYFTASIR